MQPGQGSGRGGDHYLFRPSGVPADASMFVDFPAKRAWRGLTAAVAFEDVVACVRASKGWALNSAGDWQEFAPNEVRVTDRGLLVEPAATNAIPNSTMAGAVVGSPGTRPTGWPAAFTNGPTYSQSLLADMGGLSVLGVAFAGTTTANWQHIRFCNTNVIDAAQGQTWSMSVSLALPEGISLDHIVSVKMAISVRNSDGSSQIGFLTGDNVLPLLSGNIQRFAAIFDITSATAGKIEPRLEIITDVGETIDFGLLIGGPQIEADGSTSFIETSGAAATRAADAVTINLPSGTHDLIFTFDDGSTQTIAGQSGSYVVPTNLDRHTIKSLTTTPA